MLRAFSLIELLVVISIIAVLAGLVVGVAPVAGKRMREARIRAELAALVTAIESYKASLKPVAWIMAPHGVLRYDTDFRLKGPQSLDWKLPLYLLDDQP